MAIVERAGVPTLAQHEWDRPRVYILPAPDGT